MIIATDWEIAFQIVRPVRISFIEREAAAYDEAAVKANMERKETHKADQLHSAVHRCPGQAIREFNRRGLQEEVSRETVQSQLQQWPCQIKLVPVNAPYFEDVKITDCCRLYCICLCKYA